MKVYFAHAISDYNDEFEKEKIEQIKGLFVYTKTSDELEIINPRYIEAPKDGGYFSYKKNLKNIFFPLIDKCDILFFSRKSKSNKITNGVQEEINYAKKIKIVIEELNGLKKDKLYYY